MQCPISSADSQAQEAMAAFEMGAPLPVNAHFPSPSHYAAPLPDSTRELFPELGSKDYMQGFDVLDDGCPISHVDIDAQ